MRPLTTEHGTSLIEALLAVALLAIVAAGAAQLLVGVRQIALRSEQATAGMVAAAARMERLMALTWEYGVHGEALDVPVLQVAPADALERNAAGYHEVVDASGRALDGTRRPELVIRWSSVSADDDDARTRGVEVCAFAWPADEASAPLACLASARGRRP